MITIAGGILLAVFALLVLFGFALMLRSFFRTGWKLLSIINPLAVLVLIFVAYNLWRVIALGGV